MATTRTGAKSPTLQKQDAVNNIAEVLKDVPALLEPSQFRQTQRSGLLKLSTSLAPLIDNEGRIKSTPETMAAAADVFAAAEEFFESIALDQEAFVAWSTGLKNSTTIYGTLLFKYASAVGE